MEENETHRPLANASSADGQCEDVSRGLSILLVDDNRHVIESLGVVLRLAGHHFDCAEDPEEANSRLATRRYDLILLDLNYAPGRTDGAEGLALLTRILADDPSACVVVITAHSGIRIAVEAMRSGARDFVMKPWRNADLLTKLERIAGEKATSAPTGRRPLGEPAKLIGDSEAIARVRQLIRRIAPTMAGVVVTGLPGTGRTLVATALHDASPSAVRPMVRIDLRDPIAWDRLDEDAGTLLLRHPDFLDAIQQQRLLDRVPDDVRTIAIANDLTAISPALARRIAAVEIAVPPLNARGQDPLLLARHFLRVAAQRYGLPLQRLSPAAEKAILNGPWPDEVRGLAAAIERASLIGDGDIIDLSVLRPAPLSDPVPTQSPRSSRFDLEENERAVIEAALREHHHNVTHAAAALGLSRGSLYRRMERYGL